MDGGKKRNGCLRRFPTTSQQLAGIVGYWPYAEEGEDQEQLLNRGRRGDVRGGQDGTPTDGIIDLRAEEATVRVNVPQQGVDVVVMIVAVSGDVNVDIGVAVVRCATKGNCPVVDDDRDDDNLWRRSFKGANIGARFGQE